MTDSQLNSYRTLFHGRVQGVGFRFTSKKIAGQFPVVGTVRNLPNGTVELLATCRSEIFDQLLDAIQEEMGPNISQIESKQLDEILEFDAFQIGR